MSLLLNASPNGQTPIALGGWPGPDRPQHAWDRCRYLRDLIARLECDGHQDALLDEAKWHLYCATYATTGSSVPAGGRDDWEAVQAMQRKLNQAERAVTQFLGFAAGQATAWATDLNADSDLEVRLQNRHLLAWLAPAAGGRILNLDLLNNLQSVLATGLPSFVEHLSTQRPAGSTREQPWFTEAMADHAGRAAPAFQGQIRRGVDRLQILLKQPLEVDGIPLRLSKSLAIRGRAATIELAYLVEGLPDGYQCRLASLWHLPHLSSRLGERVLHDGQGRQLTLGERPLQWLEARGCGLTDPWLGLDLRFSTHPSTEMIVWLRSAPRCAHSGGPLPPALAVVPNWEVTGDASGRWSTRLKLCCHATRGFDGQPLGRAPAMNR
jgi:alpha-amylase